MTGAFTHPIDTLSVLAMNGLEYGMQSPFMGRYQHKVDVIGHETVSDGLYAPTQCIFPQQVQVTKPVTAAEENLLTIVATLRDMMRHTWNDEARMARHADTLSDTNDRKPKTICANQLFT